MNTDTIDQETIASTHLADSSVPPSASDPITVTPVRPHRVEILENIRLDANTCRTTSVTYRVAEEDHAAFVSIKTRCRQLLSPSFGPFPKSTGQVPTAAALIQDLRTEIRDRTQIDENTSTLLAHWALATWFIDSLVSAPCLTITGNPGKADRILQALRGLCRNPHLMLGLSRRSLMELPWDVVPTLLINEPNLTKKMATVVVCSTRSGYTDHDSERRYFDLFTAKAIYVGDALPSYFKPPCSLHIVAAPGARAACYLGDGASMR